MSVHLNTVTEMLGLHNKLDFVFLLCFRSVLLKICILEELKK